VPGSRGTFLLALHPYRGRPIRLADGTVVGRGDPVAEVHFWNARIAAYRGSGTREITWRMIRDLRADFAALAATLAAMEEARRPRAVYGVTPLAEGAVRLGFETRPLPQGPVRRLLTVWQGAVLRRVFHPLRGGGRAAVPSQEVWMSYGELQRRFGAGQPRDGETEA
jgi:hypothetical protein